jgi:hypothetical protein
MITVLQGGPYDGTVIETDRMEVVYVRENQQYEFNGDYTTNPIKRKGKARLFCYTGLVKKEEHDDGTD